MNQLFLGRILIAVLLIVVSRETVESLPSLIRVGGIFEYQDVKEQIAFAYSVDRANMDREASYGRMRYRLESMMERIPRHNSFEASKRVCGLLRKGIAAIFGPQSGQTSAHVQSICDAMEVPHVETRWDFKLKKEDHHAINLFPHPSSLSRAYLDLVRMFQWKSFVILYEDNEGLILLQEILKTSAPKDLKKSIRQLPEDGNYRDLLKNVKQERETNIIIDCKTENVGKVLKHAQQIGMMTPYNNYIITSLDLHLVDLEDFRYGGSNITAMRLIDPTRPDVQSVMAAVKDAIKRHLMTSNYVEDELDQHEPGTETALMYDAVQIFMRAIQTLDNSTDVQIPPLMCEGEEAWVHGSSLINYMKLVNLSGLTGIVEFDSLGYRTNFELDIVELYYNGFSKVGTWSTRYGINYTTTLKDLENKTMEGLRNRTLLVSFAFNDPYIMLKESANSLTGNDRYEGFCIDLLNEIAEIIGFNYTLVPVPDERYGSKNDTTGEWNGMIAQLLKRKADMAITDLTINFEREEAVDFTMPFMNMGVAIIYKKPRKMAPSLFSFMSPLSLEVWFYMVAAYLGVSALMYILARFSPYEWQNPHPCDPEPDVLENQFTILNCLWFAIGSLMQQGCDFLPQAMSTRMVAGMWWFFTLIMISSYTANLAAFLTVERMESPIESVEDLAGQTKIKYGAMVSGTTAAFFRDSNVPMLKKMWAFMDSQTPSVFVKSNNEGYDRVQEANGLYAFLSESSSIEYIIERKCDLTQVGGLLDSKSYGIALPPGSPYTGSISQAILALHEKSFIHKLKIKWWKEMRVPETKCEEAGGSSMASELNLSNVGGVFVVLIGGMGLALVVAITEFLVECRDISNEEESPFIQILQQELRFVFKCRGSVKPVKKKAEPEEENIYGADVYNYNTESPLT